MKNAQYGQWNFLICLLSLLTLSLGCFSSGNNKSDPTDFKSPANAVGATLSISNVNAVPLYKDIHAACAVDIFFTKGMARRDILTDPYLSFVRAFNFTSLQYSGGSTADHDHVIVGDTLVYGGRGDGYNMSREDSRVRGESFDELLDGIGTVKFGVDFFNQYCALLRTLKIRGDIIANVQGGTLAELYWKIQRTNARRVIFGMEQNLDANRYDFADGSAYKKKISQWIDSVERKFPGIITVIDAAPIWKVTSKSSSWNNHLKTMPGDEARIYLWDKDLFTTGDNAASNLATINQSFLQTIPQWLNQFTHTFPGKKASVWQWGLKPKSALYNKMIGCIYIAKFYKFMIDYNKSSNNFISYAAYMSLKSLDRGDGGYKNRDAANMAAALKSCGMLFKGNPMVDELSISGSNGLSGLALEQNREYKLLLINESGAEILISAVNLNGYKVQGIYRITSLSASSLDSDAVSYDYSSSTGLRLKPYSVNVVEF
ncbi:MAG: hypothetical protein H0V61_00685 [Chitinophagales bacterium]|nr:hypothetical protein [Chitinophagales bacterium]